MNDLSTDLFNWSGVGAFVLSIGSIAYAHMTRGAKAAVAAIDKLREEQLVITTHLTRLEAQVEALPRHQDFTELKVAISALAARFETSSRAQDHTINRILDAQEREK